MQLVDRYFLQVFWIILQVRMDTEVNIHRQFCPATNRKSNITQLHWSNEFHGKYQISEDGHDLRRINCYIDGGFFNEVSDEIDLNNQERFNNFTLNEKTNNSFIFEKYIYEEFMRFCKGHEEKGIELSCITRMGESCEVEGIRINSSGNSWADPGKSRTEERFVKCRRNNVPEVHGRSSIDSRGINVTSEVTGYKSKEDTPGVMRGGRCGNLKSKKDGRFDEDGKIRKLSDRRRYEIPVENYTRNVKFKARAIESSGRTRLDENLVNCTVNHVGDVAMVIFGARRNRRKYPSKAIFVMEMEFCGVMARFNRGSDGKDKSQKKKQHSIRGTRVLLNYLSTYRTNRSRYGTPGKSFKNRDFKRNGIPRSSDPKSNLAFAIVARNRNLPSRLSHEIDPFFKRKDSSKSMNKESTEEILSVSEDSIFVVLEHDDSSERQGSAFLRKTFRSIDERECTSERSLDVISPDDADKVLASRSGSSQALARLALIDAEYKDRSDSERFVSTSTELTDYDDDEDVGQDFTTWRATRITDQYFRPLLRTEASAIGRTVFPGREEIMLQVDEITVPEEAKSTENYERQLTAEITTLRIKERTSEERKLVRNSRKTITKNKEFTSGQMFRTKWEKGKSEPMNNISEEDNDENKKGKLSLNLRLRRGIVENESDDVAKEKGDTLILDEYDADYDVPEITNEKLNTEEISEELETSTVFYDDMSEFAKIIEHRSTTNEIFTQNVTTAFPNTSSTLVKSNNSRPAADDSEFKKFLDTEVNIHNNQSLIFKIFNFILSSTNSSDISSNKFEKGDKAKFVDNEMNRPSEEDLNVASSYLIPHIAKSGNTEQWPSSRGEFSKRLFKKSFAPAVDFAGKHNDNNLTKTREKLNFTKTPTNLTFMPTRRDSFFRSDRAENFSGKHTLNPREVQIKRTGSDIIFISLNESQRFKQPNEIPEIAIGKSLRMYYTSDDKKSDPDLDVTKNNNSGKLIIDEGNIREMEENNYPNFPMLNDNFKSANGWNRGRRLLCISDSKYSILSPQSQRKIRKRRPYKRSLSKRRSAGFLADQKFSKRAKRRLQKMADIVLNGGSQMYSNVNPRVNVVKIVPVRLLGVVPVAKDNEFPQDRGQPLNIEEIQLDQSHVPFFREKPNEAHPAQEISHEDEDENEEKQPAEYGNSRGIAFQRDSLLSNNSANFSANLDGQSISEYSLSPGQVNTGGRIMKITDPPYINATRKQSHRLSIEKVTRIPILGNQFEEPVLKATGRNLSGKADVVYPENCDKNADDIACYKMKSVPVELTTKKGEDVNESSSSNILQIRTNNVIISPCDKDVDTSDAQENCEMNNKKGDDKRRKEGKMFSNNMLAMAEGTKKLTKIVSNCKGQSNVVNEMASHVENILLIPKLNNHPESQQQILVIDKGKKCKGNDLKSGYRAESSRADFHDARGSLPSLLQSNSKAISNAKRDVDSQLQADKEKRGTREKRKRRRRKKKKKKRRRKLKKLGKWKPKRSGDEDKNGWLFNKRQLLSVLEDDNVFGPLSSNYIEDGTWHTFEQSLGQRRKKRPASYGIAEKGKQGETGQPKPQDEVRLPSKMNKKLHSKNSSIKSGRRGFLPPAGVTRAAWQSNSSDSDENESDKTAGGLALVLSRAKHGGYFRGTCLTDEALAHSRRKTETLETGRPGCWPSNFAIALSDPIELGTAGNGSPESPELECHSAHVSAVDTVNVRSHYNAIFRYERLRGEPRPRNRKYRHTRKPIAHGKISTFHGQQLSSNVSPTSTEIKLLDSLMVDRTELRWFYHEIHNNSEIFLFLHGVVKCASAVKKCHYSLPAVTRLYKKDFVKFRQWEQLLNRTDKSTVARRLNMQRVDFSVRLWHYFCVYVGSVNGLGCKPISPGHYHSGEFLESKCNEPPRLLNSIKDVLIFSAYFTSILLLLGLLKGLIGLFAPAVARCGLDTLLDKKKMDRYFEEDLKFRPVVTDGTGAPVHPDTGRKTVRICSRKLQLLLNLIFFLTYPMVACCVCCKNLFVPKRRYCHPDASKVHLINEMEQRPKLIRVSTYGDCRNSKMEAEDTEYVLNELKKSQESLVNVKSQTKKRHRTGSISGKDRGEAAGKFVRDLLEQRVVFRNLTEPIADVDVPAGVLYSLRGYFMNSEEGGYLFVTSCPFKQYWTISEGGRKAVVPARIYQSSLFTRSFDTVPDVYDSDELSFVPKGICINVQFLDDR